MLRKKKVPIRHNGTGMTRITMVRQSLRKIKTTKKTRMKASIRVENTLSIEAERKLLASKTVVYSMPSGNDLDASAIAGYTFSTTSWAFEPAVCEINNPTLGEPLALLTTE